MPLMGIRRLALYGVLLLAVLLTGVVLYLGWRFIELLLWIAREWF